MTYEPRATHTATRFYGRLNGAELLGLSAVLVAAYALVHSGSADAGAATTAALFFVGLFDPVNTMLGRFDSVQQAAAGLARIVGVTLGGPASDERPQGPISHPGTALVVHDVHHRYGTGPDVLHGVDLELGAGQRLAIVGATGSGKSTLASLIAALRLPSSGRVTLGGTDTAGLAAPTPDGRRRIMLVTQEHHLFLGTVADNLRLARRDASASDLAAALAVVGATGWIDALPDGIDTAVGT
ncbi:ATP-binding cassette domain-containing protein [Streptomyces sp. NBC_00989]|uniref:ATP-binding cassette domain-containing protein n=1 Tax=Streptomyces sp. NBC_00989 TaxID=2903705 RepID=UPI00386371A6|nr:ABC transporter ATP-binding protein/permease [Streptomyces sp. NBC_00989]